MSQRSLEDLILEIRQRSDNEIVSTDNEDPFVSDSELTNYVNNSLADLYDTVREANADQRFNTNFSFQTTAGEDTYPLPDDFLALSGVDVNVAGFIYAIYQNTLFERNRYSNLNNPGWLRGARQYYRIRGDDIVFSPQPQAQHTVTLLYVPEPPTLVDGADLLTFPQSFFEWLILDCAIKVLLKEESDVQMLEAEKSRAEARIRSLAPKRDDGAPQVVTDASRQWDLWLL